MSQINNYSFCIPAVGNASEEKIKREFWLNNIGEVSRVDFFENSSGLWCAFVHFSEFYDNNNASRIINEIENYGSYQFWFNRSEYFILRKMNCPKIPDTYMNIHQIADKLAQHEAKIAELEAKIAEKDEIIYEYRQKQMEAIEYGRIMYRTMRARSPSSDSYDLDMGAMVDSLAGPRWPEEDDTGFAAIYPVESDDCKSVGSTGSSSRRILMSAEFCGNN